MIMMIMIMMNDNDDDEMIDKQDFSPTCRLCGEREETVTHITTEYNKLSQRQYIRTGGTIRLLNLFIGISTKITICSAKKLSTIILQRE